MEQNLHKYFTEIAYRSLNSCHQGQESCKGHQIDVVSFAAIVKQFDAIEKHKRLSVLFPG